MAYGYCLFRPHLSPYLVQTARFWNRSIDLPSVQPVFCTQKKHPTATP